MTRHCNARDSARCAFPFANDSAVFPTSANASRAFRVNAVELSKSPSNHTVAQYRAMPRGVRAVYRVLRHPAVFFPIAPLLTWYVKMVRVRF